MYTFIFFVIKCAIDTQHYCGFNNFFVENTFQMSGKVGRNCHCLPSEVSYYSNTQKLPPLRDMTESRHMLQEHKLRWGWKVCCNQYNSLSSFSDLRLFLMGLHKRPEKSIVFSSLVLSFALGWDLVDKSFVPFKHSWDPLIHSINIFTRLFQII